MAASHPDDSPDQRDAARTLRRARWKAALVSGFLALVGLAFVQWRESRQPVAMQPAQRPAATLSVAPPRPRDPQAVMRIYRKSIVPLLDEHDRENEKAVSRAMMGLHMRMNVHRAGVVPFARDVRSWGTRFGVLHRMPSDLWHRVRHTQAGPSQVALYVNDKFRREVISDPQLQSDIKSILTDFQQDLLANRNRLYARLSLPLEQIRAVQSADGLEIEPLMQQIDRNSAAIGRELAPDTVVSGIVEFSASWIATDVAQSIASRVVAQILARVGTSMAVEGLSAGGATVGGTATGAGAGSFAGPAGTIIGLGVGLVVGAAVDWWLSDQFEAKVTLQCNQFLNRLEARLCDGSGSTPGFRATLAQAASIAGQAQRRAIEKAIQGGQSP